MKDEPKEYKNWLYTKTLQKIAILDAKGNLLVLTRREDGFRDREGKEDLPGGTISRDDLRTIVNPHLTSLNNEITAETGLEVDGVRPIWTGSGIKNSPSDGEILVYGVGYRGRVHGAKPEVVLSEEHASYQWVEPEKWSEIDFGDDGGMHPGILKALIEDSKK